MVRVAALSRRSITQTDLRPYLKRIGEVPLLTAEEESRLGWAIVNDGCAAARERMVLCNLRLVVFIAKNYVDRGLSLQDLVEEGNIGLLRAIARFDPSRGARLSTYAGWWINQAIRMALNATKPVHVPSYMIGLIMQWERANRRLRVELGREPRLLEVAEELGLPLRKVRRIQQAAAAFRGTTQSRLDEDGNASAMNEHIADHRTPSPQDAAMRREDVESIGRLLEAMDARESRIVRLRFGLDRTPMTLTQIGTEMGISRERVRQLIDEALRKLNVKIRQERSDRKFSLGMSGTAARRREDRRPTSDGRAGWRETAGSACEREAIPA